MKKNIMMRAASGLAVATLLTTSLIGGTFAKYTTTAEGTDTARVAKWGVNIEANGETFATSYTKDDQATTITNTVVSTDEVVAPGTKGNMTSMTLTGTPEVAVKVTYSGEFALNDNWKVDGTYYCPLEIKVNDDVLKGTDYTSATDFVNAVNEKINSYSKEYAVGTDLSGKENESLKVSWSWAYEGANEKDTKLADAASEGTDADVTLKVATTVTQID